MSQTKIQTQMPIISGQYQSELPQEIRQFQTSLPENSVNFQTQMPNNSVNLQTQMPQNSTLLKSYTQPQNLSTLSSQCGQVSNLFTEPVFCKDHPRYLLESICINKNCKKQNRFLCFQCFRNDLSQYHVNHANDILSIKSFQELELTIKDREHFFHQNWEKQQQFQQIIEIEFQKISDLFQQSLLAVKNEVLLNHQHIFETEISEESVFNELLTETLKPLEDVYKILQQIQNDSDNKFTESKSKQIKDLFHTEQYLKTEEAIQMYKDLQKHQGFQKQQLTKLLQKFQINTDKLLAVQNEISQFMGRKNQNFDGLTSFEPSTYANSTGKVDLSLFQSDGLVKFKYQKKNTRIFSNDFGNEDLLIFKLKIPNIEFEQDTFNFSMGVVEEKLKNENKDNNFGAGNWVMFHVENCDRYKKDKLVVNRQSKDLRKLIKNEDELIVLIKPEISLFTIFVKRTKLIIKNTAQFENLENNKKWNFHIYDYMPRTYIFDNNIEEEDMDLITKFNLL